MTSRGEHEFPFIITSDASMDLFPENKTSKFKVFLKNPIEVDEDHKWEVSLRSINYPYTWTNVGPSCKVYMKYYINHRDGVQSLDFPDWQCVSEDEIVGFMKREFERQWNKDESEGNRVIVGKDELGRFKLKCMSKSFDVGFSENMMKLLGMAGHRHAAYMTVEAFDKRQFHRDLMDRVFAKKHIFDWHDGSLRKSIQECTTYQELVKILALYVDWDIWNDAYFREDIENRLQHEWVGAFKGQLSEAAGMGLMVTEDLMYHLKELVKFKPMQNTMRGVTPFSMNPVKRMYIYSNILDPIDVNDKGVRLLKLVNTYGSAFDMIQEEYTHPLYLPVRKGKISLIEVFIADESGDPVPFQLGTVVLTLHFRKVAKYRR